jgi:hypothetical protein
MRSGPWLRLFLLFSYTAKKKTPLGVDPIFRLGVRGKVKDLRVSTNCNQYLIELMIVEYRFKSSMQPFHTKNRGRVYKLLHLVSKLH